MTNAIRGSYDVEDQPRPIPIRTMGELLNETFAAYWKRLRPLVGLVAVMQLPISLLDLLPGGIASAVAVNLVGALGGTFVFGAIVCAMGQHSLGGAINVGRCYSRVWWRVFSLGSVGIVLAGLSLLVYYFATAAVADQSLARGAILLLAGIPVTVGIMYALFTPQAIVMEGLRPLSAVRRSCRLVQGSWWRVFGITLTLLLVIVGVSLLLGAPFALASGIAAPKEATAVSQAIQFVGSLVAGIAVPPVTGIALTLLYYDLRVRKENYDLATLSREMGMAAAS